MSAPLFKKALIFYHKDFEGPEIFGDLLQTHGIVINMFFAPDGAFESLRPEDYDLLIVLGGPISAYHIDDYPFLINETAFIKSWIAARKPALGICLGAQLIAHALGAKVYKGSQGREIGWHPLSLEEDVEPGHPVRHLDGALTKLVHWHADTFDLPEGARLLASTPKYRHQVFEKGNVLGLQAHPEVRAEQFEGWLDIFKKQLDEENISREGLVEQTEKYIGNLNAQAEKFFLSWLYKVNILEN